MTEVETILEMMRILDSTEEVGDCLIWQGADNGEGRPHYTPHLPGLGKLVHRAMFKLNGGKVGIGQPLGCRCREKMCVNPDHYFPSSYKDCHKKAAKEGVYSSPVKSAKIANTKRAKHAKLTIEIAREIRMSDESGAVWAKRLGVDPSVPNGIKAGTRWKEYSGSNPFAGLMQ